MDYDDLIQKILESTSRRKVIIAGPGTRKSTFFKKAVSFIGGNKTDFLALTFINNLKAELEKDLRDEAKVYTFHGYCLFLLLKYKSLRFGLKEDFFYYPPLVEIIKSDWKILKDTEAPKFIDLMRNLNVSIETPFFVKMGNYYNAVGYDDSVFRVCKSFEGGIENLERYKLIIVDEYQDFNLLETRTLAHLIESNPVLIAGDDDQALYCDLRGSDPEFIRKLLGDDSFDKFSLPFCFRCPSPVVNVFNSFVDIAKSYGFLKERITKEFKPSSTKKKDGELYPFVKLVLVSMQNKALHLNYFGRYILQEIKKIPKEEIEESNEKNFPTVLIIGPTYVLKSIIPVLENKGVAYGFKMHEDTIKVTLEDGLKILKKDKESNLGWRIILEVIKPEFFNMSIKAILESEKNLSQILPPEFIQEIIKQVEAFEVIEESIEQEEIDKTKSFVKLTTFEGAKGLSAQHVFIVGLQNRILPRNPNNIRDIDICKFLVAITRTRKQCYILSTWRFGGVPTQISEFIKWLQCSRIPELQEIKINKDYWLNEKIS